MATRISVLPKDLVDALTIELAGEKGVHASALLRLPHPRTAIASLFLPVSSPSGTSAILELQNVAPNASRSWFNGSEVVSDGSMLLMTPVDPVFLLVPILKAVSPLDGSAGNFRTLDDILEDASIKLTKEESANELAELISGDIVELSRLSCIQEAMRRICDAKDIASDLVVYRFSHRKLLEYLGKKATRLANGDFAGKSRTLERELAKDGLLDDGKEELLRSGRLKLACDLVSQYTSQDVHEELLARFNFSSLTYHLEALKQMDLINGMASSNGKVQKMRANENSNGSNGKKRKATSHESVGVTKLKKANIRGMAKLSSFFQKKA